MYGFFLSFAMLGSPPDSQELQAQVFHPSTNTDYAYPTAAMTPTNYYADGKVNQLSNFSMQSSRIGGGHELFASGWSNGNDGGFCVLTSTPAFPTPLGFAGRRAVDLPGVRDVQVAFLENDANTYLVVAYYDNNTQNYGFNLYNWTPSLSTLAYTYQFVDPHYPNLPSSASSKMEYNRIAIDVSKDKQRIAFVLTDGANSNMYTAVGQLMPRPGGGDTIMFSPNLLHPTISTAATVWTTGTLAPWAGFVPPPPVPCGWPASYDPSVYKCDALGNAYIDMPYNPLIRLRAQSSLVISPAYRPEYKQVWPDVAFNDNNITYSFYCPEKIVGLSVGLRGLFVFQNLSYSDLYNYAGGTAFDHYCEYFDMAYHTEDGISSGNTIYDVPPTGLGLTTSGNTVFNPFVLGTEELRANLDAPDMLSNTWALAFAYNNEVHARYYNGLINQDAVVNSDKISYNFDITAYRNTDVDIAYNPSGNRLHLAWVSEGFPSFPMITTINDKSIIGLEIDPNTPTPPAPGPIGGGSASLVSLPNYLIIPYRPHPSFGEKALVALSKHAYDMDGLYTAFGQEDEDRVYSIMHKYHYWSPTSSPSSWRRIDPNNPAEKVLEEPSPILQVAPNPIAESLELRSSNPDAVYHIRISDMMGKQYYQGYGTVAILNADLNRRPWAAGTYLLQSSNAQGHKQSIKLTKQ